MLRPHTGVCRDCKITRHGKGLGENGRCVSVMLDILYEMADLLGRSGACVFYCKSTFQLHR